MADGEGRGCVRKGAAEESGDGHADVKQADRDGWDDKLRATDEGEARAAGLGGRVCKVEIDGSDER